MNCDMVEKHLDAYLDAELDVTAQVGLEQHLEQCEPCHERLALQRRWSARVRQSIQRPVAPAHLRARLSEALDQEERREQGFWQGGWGNRYVVPASAAAALMMFFGGVLSDEGIEGLQKGALQLPIFEDVVQRHAHELPAEVRGDEPEQVVTWFRGKVKFPVRPVKFRGASVRLVGARISHVHDRQAATLYYNVDGRRVTMVIFEPRRPLRNEARRVEMQGRELYYQHVHGYTVPIMEHNGITYAFTGDLDQKALLQLAANAQLR